MINFKLNKKEKNQKNKQIILEYEEKNKMSLIELLNPYEECYNYVYYNYIKIIRSINLNEWFKIKNKWINTDLYYKNCIGKYFSLKPFLAYNLRKIYNFNLHNITGKEILDLGCGSGLLLYIFKFNNNKVFGLDIQNDLFDDMLNFFKISKVTEEIKPQQKTTNINQKFDIITATLIKFDSFPNNKNWSQDDWLFFLNDIKKYLKNVGKLYLELNIYDRIHGYNDEIEKLFLGKNAKQITKYQFIFNKKNLDKL